MSSKFYLACLQDLTTRRQQLRLQLLSSHSSHVTSFTDVPPRKTRLSRTLSDVPSSESEPSDPGLSQSPQKVSVSPHSSDSSVFSPGWLQAAGDPPGPPFSNGQPEAEEEDSYYQSFHSTTGAGSQAQEEGGVAVFEDNSHLNGGDLACGPGAESHDQKVLEEASACSSEESPLIPMTLYLHRVKGLVLALLVESHFLSDTASMDEVVRRRSLLNFLKSH